MDLEGSCRIVTVIAIVFGRNLEGLAARHIACKQLNYEKSVSKRGNLEYAWKRDGSLLVTTAKDKTMQITQILEIKTLKKI